MDYDSDYFIHILPSSQSEIVIEIFGILARVAHAMRNQVNYAYRTEELPKQAKKELAIQLENSSGYDWDLEC